jgi:multidrug efflux pump subunit AcrB
LILLCILAVFAPAFIMSGVPKAMFLPLSLSIAFAMIVSFVAAQTLVPVISVWLLKAERFQYHQSGIHAHAGLALNEDEIDEVNAHGLRESTHKEDNSFFQKMKTGLGSRLKKWMPVRKIIVMVYLLVIVSAAGFCFVHIGKDLLPKTNNGQLQLRLREPQGTRLEVTEQVTKDVLSIIDSIVDHHVSISSAYVGIVPSSFGASNLYIFNSGTQEAVIQVNLDPEYKVKMENLKETIRQRLLEKYSSLQISFEPIELTEKIMAQGASTPIEVRVAGKNMEDIKSYATALMEKLRKVGFLRDVQIAQPLHMPTIQIHVDRSRLALMGLSPENIAKSVTDVTSSSRFTNKNLWLDTKNAYTYQTQIEVPEYNMNSMEQLQSVPVVKGQMRPILSDIADISTDSLPGEYDRSGPRRFVTVSANIYHRDLGSATTVVEEAISELGKPPTGLITEVKGMSSLLTETLQSLQNGLTAAIVIILLLLAANYQSFGLAITVLSTVPAVILGSMLMLLATGSTLNLQSYMGIIMSTGVSVANAILIVTNAESLRLEYRDPFKAAYTSASIRLRPILMTSLAMIAGMIPMASGLGEAGDQSAPLGRAVIGGLAASTLAALFIVPLVYGWIRQKTDFKTSSLLAEDENK